jgi:hypothetical protein
VVTVKNVVFWDITPCGSCKNRRFGVIIAFIIRVTMCHIVFLRRVLPLLVTANVVPSSPILVTLIMDAIHSSETSVLTTATRRNIPEIAILHSHRSENL